MDLKTRNQTASISPESVERTAAEHRKGFSSSRLEGLEQSFFQDKTPHGAGAPGGMSTCRTWRRDRQEGRHADHNGHEVFAEGKPSHVIPPVTVTEGIATADVSSGMSIRKDVRSKVSKVIRKKKKRSRITFLQTMKAYHRGMPTKQTKAVTYYFRTN